MKGFVVATILLLFADVRAVYPVRVCPYLLDLAFLVDSSHSMFYEYEDQLLFVQKIAERFGISQTGTHAGVIIFSDGKEFTKVTIKFKDFLNTKDFKKAVAKSLFIGYRTRIDYAFQKAEEELFTVTGGVRRFMKKAILLITDGHQYPTMNITTNAPFDPVSASQSLYDDGIKIYVVGIGQNLNRQQLEDIARDKKRVFYAKTIKTLISDDFSDKVSKKICLEILSPK